MAEILKTIFTNDFSSKKWKIHLVKISPIFFTRCLTDRKSALVLVMAWHRINDKPFLLPRKSHTDTHTHTYTHTHICVCYQSSISSCASHNDGTDLAHIISHISSSSFLSNQINIFILHAKLFRTKYIWMVEFLCVTSQICCPLIDDGSFCKWGMREIIGCWKIYRSRKGERQYIFLCITATEMSLWRNCHHWLHGSWNNDNFQCRQWRKFNQNNIFVTAYNLFFLYKHKYYAINIEGSMGCEV